MAQKTREHIETQLKRAAYIARVNNISFGGFSGAEWFNQAKGFINRVRREAKEKRIKRARERKARSILF